MDLYIDESLPTAEDYVLLRERAGLSKKCLKAAQLGLPNSLYFVSIRAGERLIAMGRVIGDGGCFFEIVDIAVDPDYQGRGLGKRIMLKVEHYIERHAHEGSYVSMIANTPLFYHQFGYQEVAPKMQGMGKVL